MCSPLGKALLAQADEGGTSGAAAGDADGAPTCGGKRPAGGSGGTEAPGRPAKAQRSDRGQPPPAPAVFKFLAPEGLSFALEAYAAIISEAAGAELDLTDNTDPFPGTSCRTACLVSDDKERIKQGMKQVLTIVVQCGACASTNRPGEFQLTTVMPAKSCAMLIGVKGQNIKDLVKTSGAHVHVEGEALGFTTGSGPGGDKLVTVRGNYAGLENATLRLVECVLEFQDQPWFPDWVVRTNAERYEPPEDRDEKGSRVAPGAKASSPADDSGIPTGNADLTPEMAAMANMCSMMLPMQCMQLMSMMPFYGMAGMCMPMMGLPACGMPGMLGTASEGSPDGGAAAGSDGAAAGVGLGAGRASGASRMCGAGGVRGLGAGSSGSGPPPGARLAAMASGSGAAGKRAKPLVYNNVPAGIIARQAKGLLNAGKLSSGYQGSRSSLPAAQEKSMERPVQENAAKEQTASARESPAELVPTVWEIGGSTQEPEPVSSDNPPDFDEELLTEEEMARKIAEQRDEIERLRKGLSSKTQLPGHRWY